MNRKRPRIDERGDVTLSTGTVVIAAHHGVFGLTPELDLTTGCDSSVNTPGDVMDQSLRPGDIRYFDMTSEECVEFADLMIERWQQFRERHTKLVSESLKQSTRIEDQPIPAFVDRPNSGPQT